MKKKCFIKYKNDWKGWIHQKFLIESSEGNQNLKFYQKSITI
jgi:hypothetical protein